MHSLIPCVCEFKKMSPSRYRPNMTFLLNFKLETPAAELPSPRDVIHNVLGFRGAACRRGGLQVLQTLLSGTLKVSFLTADLWSLKLLTAPHTREEKPRLTVA